MAYTDYLEQVQKFYVSYYGRPADPTGLLFWAQKLDEVGGDTTQIVYAFGTSAESVEKFGDLTTEEQIDEIYNQIFGRDADTLGLAFYTEKIEAGEYSLIDLVIRVADGAQGDDSITLGNRIDVAENFTATIEESGVEFSGTAATSISGFLLAQVTATTNITVYIADTVTKVVILTELATEKPEVFDAMIPDDGDFNSLFEAIPAGTDFDSFVTFFEDLGTVAETADDIIDIIPVDDGSLEDYLDALPDDITVDSLIETLGSDGLDGLDEIVPDVINQTLTGTAGDDILTGGAGNDTITAGAGNDSVTGGAGNDTLIFAENLAADDIVDGGPGTDTLTFTDSGGSSTDLDNVTTVETITLGDAETAVLTVDTLVAATATLTVDGSGLTNRLTWDGSEELDGKFVITGGSGNDMIIGGDGADTITGGAGADVLIGGAGADIYHYAATVDGSTTPGSGDTIATANFVSASDKITLVDAAFGSMGAGNLAVDSGLVAFNTNEANTLTDFTAAADTDKNVYTIELNGSILNVTLYDAIDTKAAAGSAATGAAIYIVDNGTDTVILYDSAAETAGAGTLVELVKITGLADAATGFADGDLVIV